MYVYPNIEVGLCNRCCSSETRITAYCRSLTAVVKLTPAGRLEGYTSSKTVRQKLAKTTNKLKLYYCIFSIKC
jgi:hypothetical protein